MGWKAWEAIFCDARGNCSQQTKAYRKRETAEKHAIQDGWARSKYGMHYCPRHACGAGWDDVIPGLVSRQLAIDAGRGIDDVPF